MQHFFHHICTMAKKQLSYESAMAELQQIVQQLQEQAVNMDELSEKVKRSAELLAFCREKLRKTESETQALFGE